MTITVQPLLIRIDYLKTEKKQVGEATMEEDGTIRVQVKVEIDGKIAVAVHWYKPGNAKYDRLLDNFPGLKPGVSVSAYEGWNR